MPESEGSNKQIVLIMLFLFWIIGIIVIFIKWGNFWFGGRLLQRSWDFLLDKVVATLLALQEVGRKYSIVLFHSKFHQNLAP